MFMFWQQIQCIIALYKLCLGNKLCIVAFYKHGLIHRADCGRHCGPQAIELNIPRAICRYCICICPFMYLYLLPQLKM